MARRMGGRPLASPNRGMERGTFHWRNRVHRKAALSLWAFLVGLSVVGAGCVGEEPPPLAAGGEHVTQGAAVVSGTSKVTLCNLARYTRQPTVRLCGYTTPGTDGTAIASAWFSVDGGAAMDVVPGNGGFVDTSTSLAEGTHSIRLYARSVAGNLTFEEQRVTVDVTPPVLEVLSPTSADVLKSTVVNVTSSVSDATAVRVQTQWAQSSTVDSGVGTVTHAVDLVNRGYSTLLVRATDAAGNTSESRVRVYVCPSSDSACLTSAHWAPVIIRTSQSSPTVPASGGVTFRVAASDPQGSRLSYSWTASVGTLGVPLNRSTTSEVAWTPSACMPAGTTASVTVTVTNALGMSASASFSLPGGQGCALPEVCLDNPCGANATCAALPPNGRTCTCNPGFTGDAELGCTDINECAVDNGGCAPSAETVFAVSPLATSSAPRVIDLASLGIEAGERVRFEMVGDFSYVGIENEGSLGGVFSSTPTLSGRIDAGVHYNSSAFGFDLPEDFLISYVFQRPFRGQPNVNGIELEVPAGASYVLVMMFDSFYGDNPVTDDDLGVRVTRSISCVNTPGSFHCG